MDREEDDFEPCDLDIDAAVQQDARGGSRCHRVSKRCSELDAAPCFPLVALLAALNSGGTAERRSERKLSPLIDLRPIFRGLTLVTKRKRPYDNSQGFLASILNLVLLPKS